MQIHRIALASADVAAQALFWGQTLGLTVEEGSDRVFVRLRRSTVVFVPAEPGTEPQYHFAINVPRGRAGAALAWLHERVQVLPLDDGALVIRFDGIRADAVYFHDAGGNVVELMARDELTEDSGAAFGSAELLEVAEIGIAAEDVPATSDAVRAALGAPTYWGGGEGLIAIGDLTGAVLVSPLGRGWIPTGLPALPAPTTIVAEGTPAGRTEIPGGPYVIEALA